MADGKVIIDTELDNSGVVKSSNTLKQALNNLANTMKGPFERNTSRAFLSARQKVRETEIAIQAVKDEMQQIESGSKRAGDSAYKAFDKAKQKVEENRIAMGALEEKMREISLQKTADLSDFYKDPGQLDNAVGEALSKDKEFLKLGAQFDKLIVKNQQLTYHMEEAEKTAQKMTGTASKEYQGLEKKLSALNIKLAQYKNRMENAAVSSEKVAKNGKSAGGGMKNMLQNTIPLSKSLFKVSSMLKLMVLRMVIRGAVNAAIKGFQDLAKASPSFNRSMSAISTEFLRLRNAIATAAAPALTALTPIITAITDALSRAFNTLAAFTARLFGNAVTYKKAARAAVNYSDGVNKAKNSLAGFDELEVLSNDQQSGMPDAAQMFEDVAVPQATITAVDRFKKLLEPLEKLDFTPLSQSFERLKKSLEPITRTLFSGIEWAIGYVLIPLAKWTVEDVLPEFLDACAEMFDLFNIAIESMKPAWSWLWENLLVPIAKWTGGIFLDVIKQIKWALGEFANWYSQHGDKIASVIKGIAEVALLIWNNVLKPSLQFTWDFIKALFKDLIQTALNFSASFLDIASGLINFIVGVFTGDWERAWEGVKSIFKGVWNGIVAIVEGACNLIVDCVNAVIRQLNRFKIEIPATKYSDAFSFGINLKEFLPVKIPRLAQGAVIPPNKEFMAILGDQKHGTNIEAPLDTIKQGVAEVIAELGIGSRGGDVILQVDGKTFARLMGPYQNAESRRRGVSLVTGGV